MENRFYFLSCMLMLLTALCFGQSTMGGATANAYDMNTEIGGMVSVVDFTNYDPIGNVYLFQDWKSGRLSLKNGVTSRNLVLKVNLLNNSIDVKDKDKVRTFSIEKISTVEIAVLTDSLIEYVNPNEYVFYDNTPVIGLLRKVTHKGAWTIIERNYLKIFEANYVKALDAGSKQDRYEVAKELYLLKDGIVFPVGGNRKSFVKRLGLLDDRSEDLLKYMKEANLSNKKIEHLQEITSFLNI